MVLESKYPFIRDDVFLIARVYEGNENKYEDEEINKEFYKGKQELIIQKINLDTKEVEFEDHIGCIHTALTKISVKKFAQLYGDVDAQETFYKKTLNIKSSERIKSIKLKPEERFKALKSWVAGIAEAGKSAFNIQGQIDRNLNQVPIARFLLKFMAKIDEDILTEFLMKIERECIFEGKVHEPSMIANLHILNSNIRSAEGIVLDFIIENYAKYLFTADNKPENDQWSWKKIRGKLASSINAPIKFPELYQMLFDDSDYIKSNVAHNPEATRFREKFQKLFFDSNKKVRNAVAANKKAVTVFPDLYKDMFRNRIPYSRYQTEFRTDQSMIAFNTKTPKHFPEEYVKFFASDNIEIIKRLAGNLEVPKIFPNEYKKFFTGSTDIRFIVAGNKNAMIFEEYKSLFTDKEHKVRWRVARNDQAQLKFPELYKELFKDSDESVISAVLENINTPARFPKCYKPFFQSNNKRFLRSIARNMEAIEVFPTEFEQLLDKKVFDIMYSATIHNEGARKLFPEKFEEFLKFVEEEIEIQYRNHKILSEYSKDLRNISGKLTQRAIKPSPSIDDILSKHNLLKS